MYSHRIQMLSVRDSIKLYMHICHGNLCHFVQTSIQSDKSCTDQQQLHWLSKTKRSFTILQIVVDWIIPHYHMQLSYAHHFGCIHSHSSGPGIDNLSEVAFWFPLLELELIELIELWDLPPIFHSFITVMKVPTAGSLKLELLEPAHPTPTLKSGTPMAWSDCRVQCSNKILVGSSLDLIAHPYHMVHQVVPLEAPIAVAPPWNLHLMNYQNWELTLLQHISG